MRSQNKIPVVRLDR